jgi:hypothetical protein
MGPGGRRAIRAGQAASHSLLLERGLFRVFLPWPPRTSLDEAIEPEFTIEVLGDPTGCNTDPVYGLGSENPTISVYRRPSRGQPEIRH